ncbi:hypothetical protein ACQ3G6_17035 [Allorhizobium undicola]|uniref:hypothetical protein n=1 Tax=Allorhizobium undicola TaxID=78527 RepID=UPI003D32A016
MTSGSAGTTTSRIICLGVWADYAEFFWKRADPDRFDLSVVQVHQEARRHPLYQFAPSFARGLLHTLAIRRCFRDNPEALFVVNEVPRILKFLLDMPFPRKVAVVMRNPMASKPKLHSTLNALHSHGTRILSFDPQDCSRYGFEHYRQYLEPLPGLHDIPIQHDFGFYGADKGRRPFLEKLSAELKDRGFSTRLHFPGDSRQTTRRWFGRKPRKARNSPYARYLAETLAARCLIDILQPGQNGLTLRPLEALFYGRKLLTNNRAIAEEPFFHPANIFILDEAASLDGLERFMAAPMADIDPAITALYGVNRLLQQLTNPSAGAETTAIAPARFAKRRVKS